MTFREQIVARGHENVRSTHESTVEITTDDWLTTAGDCIVGISADCSPASFDPSFVSAAQSTESVITLELSAGPATDQLSGRGAPALTFASDRCLIARTSSYIDDRTVLVDADRAAKDLDRELVEYLQNGATLTATLTVRPGDQ